MSEKILSRELVAKYSNKPVRKSRRAVNQHWVCIVIEWSMSIWVIVTQNIQMEDPMIRNVNSVS
jgi:hypothetical protein